jgi:hypothetical protein
LDLALLIDPAEMALAEAGLGEGGAGPTPRSKNGRGSKRKTPTGALASHVGRLS